MVLLKFKSLLTGLLLGDTTIPEDSILIELIGMSLLTVATKAEPLSLMTVEHSKPILRLGLGDYGIRKPEKPININDVNGSWPKTAVYVNKALAFI